MRKVDGGCHCGNITYEAEIDPSRIGICHCTDCQTFSGGAFSASVVAPKESFRMRGEPTIYVKTADSGNRRAQAFCAGCGSPIYSSALADPPMYSLRVACLDERADLPPRKQIWCRSSLDWAMDVRELPQAERQ